MNTRYTIISPQKHSVNFFPSIRIPPGRPFDLAVFEDRLWITDQKPKQLRSVHKRTGRKLQRIHGNMVQPASVVVVHPLAKPGTEMIH